jgi:hypothetical protein
MLNTDPCAVKKGTIGTRFFPPYLSARKAPYVGMVDSAGESPWPEDKKA